MKILLFDMHDDGHHLEYASRLQLELREVMADHEIDTLLLKQTERHSQYFNQNDVQYLYTGREEPPDTEADGPLEYALESVKRPRDQVVEKLFKRVKGADYDILHLLHLDDIIKEVGKNGPLPDTKIVGTLNGAYFKFIDDSSKHAEHKFKRWGVEGIAKYIPAPLTRIGPWSALNLRHAVQEGAIDEIFVPTEDGRQDVLNSIGKDRLSAPIIPDPIEPWFDETTSREEARNRLGMDTEDFVLLFFGGMRHEKGADILLEALEKYQGQPLTAIFAGKPVSIEPEEFQVENPLIDLRVELEFIPDSDVPLYFLATDTVILPYRRSFGKFRPSGVFQKGCGALRPIVAPRFGMFEKRITEWNLGLTFEPESSESLASSLEKVRQNPIGVYDVEKMREYASSQTYEKMAEIIIKTYHNEVVSE